MILEELMREMTVWVVVILLLCVAALVWLICLELFHRD